MSMPHRFSAGDQHRLRRALVSRTVENFTPLFVGSAITRWYKSPSPLDKERPTFPPSAPTLPTIPLLLRDVRAVDQLAAANTFSNHVITQPMLTLLDR